MGQLRDLLNEKNPNIAAVETYLDGLDSEQRVAEIRTLGRGQQARLFDAAEGHKPISLEDIVGRDCPPMQEVVHHGKNSLPAFTHFAKVFVRPASVQADELWGGSGTSARL